jgi:hypothetical protein
MNHLAVARRTKLRRESAPPHYCERLACLIRPTAPAEAGLADQIVDIYRQNKCA